MTIKHPLLQEAACDFRYLLNRGYPRKGALELVGNRYQLTLDERHLLHRGVFSEEDSQRRRTKKISFHRLRNRDLAIDGHNVLMTLEAGLSGRSLICGDDGFIRDISGVSGNYRKSNVTEEALQLLFHALKRIRPRHILFLLDAPISGSGSLASEIRKQMKQEAISGDAQAIKVPERILHEFPGVVATSDSAILDRAKMAVDLAGDLLKQKGLWNTVLSLEKRKTSLGK